MLQNDLKSTSQFGKTISNHDFKSLDFKFYSTLLLGDHADVGY